MICGYAFFARYSVLPDWLAWATFGEANGTASFRELRERILMIRQRIRFRGAATTPELGCILLVQPVFFEERDWVSPPANWPVRTQSYIGYDLTSGEGARIWADCLAVRSHPLVTQQPGPWGVLREPPTDRYGAPALIQPRLGQGTFRVAVIDAYGRACAITQEHSLPALEAAHIRSYSAEGPHVVGNGLLLRADFHNLLDTGYVTITQDHRLEVSKRLRDEYENGRSYYPYHGKPVRLPARPADRPQAEFLEWHRANCYLG